MDSPSPSPPNSGRAVVASARVPPPSPPSTPNSQPSLQPPPIPDFELLRCIGRGAYGEVWLARDVLGQCRAVKIIYRSRFTEARPFEREFEGIQRFEPISRSHPSQLHILHVGKNDASGCFYYVMELADAAESRRVSSGQCSVSSGQTTLLKTEHLKLETYEPHTLRFDLEERKRLPIPDCVQIGLSLATALQHLHENKLVHRDIKPSNIIFVNGVAKLGDIGLVTDAGDTQSIVGTEGYLPPEGPGTPQADLYSLGKVLYEMSTGMDRRRFAELPDDLPTWPDPKSVMEFNEIVLRACAKDPAQRYQTAEELRADLALLQEGQSISRARRLATWRRHAVMATVALAVLAVGTTFFGNRLRREESLNWPDGPPSTNELANFHCAKALMQLRSDSYVSYGEVYTNLHQAIDLDPNFARPYIGLFELRLREVGGYKVFRPDESMDWIASKLQELGPSLSATWLLQCRPVSNRWDFPRIEALHLKAIQAAPHYELAHTSYAYWLMNWGRVEEAERELAIARQKLPGKATNYRFLGYLSYARRDFTNAVLMYRQATAGNKNDGVSFQTMGWAYRALGEYEKAIDCLETSALIFGSPPADAKASHGALRQAVASRGARGYWDEVWSQLNQSNRPRFYEKAQAKIHLGDTNAALDFLYSSFHARELQFVNQPWMNILVVEESWDGIRAHPRFQELLDRVGFTKVNPKLKQ